MPANVQSIAFVGDVPWHGLGKEVPPTVTAAEMIEAADLNWMVEKRRAAGARIVATDFGEDIYSRYELVRLAREGRDEQDTSFGMVSRRYEPLQNRDAFEFFDPMISSKKARYHTAGALGDGERVWVQAMMPNDIEVVKGDVCKKYLLLSNTHNGHTSIIVKFTAVRVVCQNTLTLALEDKQPAFRVRHSLKMADRLQEIAKLIAAANITYEKAAQSFRKLASTPLRDQTMLEGYLQMIYPRTVVQKRDNTLPPKWDAVNRLLASRDDLKLPGVRGTMWAAYNAVTRLEDFREVRNESDSSRLDRVWFGKSADMKRFALDMALEFTR